jgi:hypothetical protein
LEDLMTAMPTVYTEFGQSLAFAERTMSATLHDHLAKRSVEPETWYALKLISLHEAGAERAVVLRNLEVGRGMEADAGSAVLARLDREGLIAGDMTIEFTRQGREFFFELRDYVVGATAELLSQFDLEDIETTVRTIQAVTRQAASADRDGD